VVVTHGDQLGSPTPEALNAAFPAAEIIIYGHTHRPLLTTVDVVVTVMNPGGAGARRFGLPPSVGIMELEAGIPPRARLVPLLDFEPEG
jgi:predicted phosphodiesterase